MLFCEDIPNSSGHKLLSLRKRERTGAIFLLTLQHRLTSKSSTVPTVEALAAYTKIHPTALCR